MDATIIAKNFLDYIAFQDLSEIGLDASNSDDLREYLEIIEKENDDALYFLEEQVAPIEDIWNSFDEIEKLVKERKN